MYIITFILSKLDNKILENSVKKQTTVYKMH